MLMQPFYVAVPFQLENKRKEQLTPVYATGLNVSPLSKCLNTMDQDVTWGFMPPWEVGSIDLFIDFV